MKLIRYGITLRRITLDDIEKVRVARNAIRHLMQYQEYITPEMQLKWFKSIDNTNNFYYIIEYKNEDTGLIHEKNTSVKPGERFENSEGGIFMFDKKYHASPIPVLSALILIEKGFFIFGDLESVIHIVRNNEAAIRFNKALGYELREGHDNNDVQEYILTKERYQKKTAAISKTALKLSGTENNLKIVLSAQDYDSGLGQEIQDIFAKVGLFPVSETDGEKTLIYSYD
jgi:plasmid maintenance system antidote protein VapI